MSETLAVLELADGGKLTRDIAARVSHAEHRIAIVGDAAARTRVLFDVAERLEDALLVRVPHQLDRVPHVLLSLAAQCGGTTLHHVANAVGTGKTGALLVHIERALGPRPLLVADLDRLRPRGLDRDLPSLEQPMGELRRWLQDRASVATFDLEPRTFQRIAPPGWRPRSGFEELWRRVGHDPDRFALGVVRRELGAEPTEDPGWDAESLVQDVWSAASSRVRALLFALAVHGRPITSSLLLDAKLCDQGVLERAVHSGLIEHGRPGEVWLAHAWYEHCPDLQIPERRTEGHRRLGKAFAELARRADADPITVLEACRHLSEAGEVAEAAEFARFGAVLLLDAGRRSSLSEDWDGAIRAYDIVENLPALDDTTRAYAIHYGAYNRYKRNEREPIAATLRAYAKSVKLWPENARFWSRLVSGLCIDGRRAEALGRLNDALHAVPAHPNKLSALVGKTTERLLERHLVQDAALVWGGTTPTGALEDPGKQLEERLAEGFDDRRIHGEPELVLYEPRRLRVTKAGDAWSATGLDTTERGPSPRAAIAAWTHCIRAEAERLLRTPTHVLTPTERLRKRVLLGAIDVYASRIGPRANDLWVAGTLERDGEEVVLVTEDGERFVVVPQLRDEIHVTAPYRLGRVELDPEQRPHGPVLELQPVQDVDPEALWDEWKRVVGEG